MDKKEREQFKAFVLSQPLNKKGLKSVRAHIEEGTTIVNKLNRYLELAKDFQYTKGQSFQLLYQAIWQGLNSLLSYPTGDKADSLLALHYAEMVKKNGSVEPAENEATLTRFQGKLLYVWYHKHLEDNDAYVKAKQYFRKAIKLGDYEADQYLQKDSKSQPTKKIAIQLVVNGNYDTLDGKLPEKAAKQLKKLFIQKVVKKGVSLEDFEADLNQNHPALRAALDKATKEAIDNYLQDVLFDADYEGDFIVDHEFDGENDYYCLSDDNKIKYNFEDLNEYIED